jgi:hypothetical protein
MPGTCSVTPRLGVMGGFAAHNPQNENSPLLAEGWERGQGVRAGGESYLLACALMRSAAICACRALSMALPSTRAASWGLWKPVLFSDMMKS